MLYYDVIIIGGGVIGCFTARNITKYKLSAAVLEASEDVCTGITRRNAAVIYPGIDSSPDSLKTSMSLRANADFDALCEELQVEFHRCGMLRTACGPAASAFLERKLSGGILNGVPGLTLMSGDEARELEPSLSPSVVSALYAPTAGTVDPWELGIAAFENAVKNGAEAHMNTLVEAVSRNGELYTVTTNRGEFSCRALINCAGAGAAAVRDMLMVPEYRQDFVYNDFLLLDRSSAGKPSLIISEETENGKGITAVPTTVGAVLIESRERNYGTGCETDADSISSAVAAVNTLLPGMDVSKPLRTFAAAKPVVRRLDTPSSKRCSFVTENNGKGFISFLGIKTPGLTCANELSSTAAVETAKYLCAVPREDRDGRRERITHVRTLPLDARKALIESNPDYGEIVCRCEEISRGEIIEAIKRGAVTADGVKRRTGAMMGSCQGSRCLDTIAALISEYSGVSRIAVRLNSPGSYIYGEDER